MAEEKKVEPELSNVQQIVQHAMNSEPSKIKSLVNKEIASRVMTHIETKKTEVGSTIFGK